jgi:hypothetical protein
MTPKTRKVIDHVARYHVTAIDPVHALLFQDRTYEAARVCLYRLTEAGYLTRFEIRSRSFYRLTLKACRAADLPPSLARVFDTQALRERFGVLVYCCLRDQKRSRLMPAEFAEFFPTLAGKRGVHPAMQHYVIDQADGKFGLSRIIVDGGTPTARLVRKCHDLVRDASACALQEVITQGSFRLTLLTAEATKQQAILAALRRSPVSVPVAVEALPELKHILSSSEERSSPYGRLGCEKS